MSTLLELPASVLLLLPISLAAGADFFLTVLVLGLSQSLGWPGIQEPGLHPLHWGALSIVAALYLLETAAEFRPTSALVWHTLQLLLRPVGGLLVALALLDGAPGSIQLLGALAAGTVCAFTHVLSWGQQLLLFLSPTRKISIVTRVLAEDALVLAFLFLALERPEVAFPLSAPLLILGLIFGGPLHHAVRFGLVLLWERLFGFLQPSPWRAPEDLPAWVRDLGASDRAGTFRGMPAGLRSPPGSRGFREGWLLERGTSRDFVFRRRRKGGVVPLEGSDAGEEERLALALRIPFTAPDGRRSALFLQRTANILKSHK